ncbi:ATPase [Nonlabens sp. YIK11]|uniref:AAA family ATPase n=1 Tax=Nonlabens sp. YIK11 TaxID=1453349 RepID=UPI0006DCCF59|nr:ATP-binding protein [Nonlabens sp. YIK11]KQC33715.1 ATPase [Nonlabens sp. YIK11]
MEKIKRILLIGGPGSGKTTLIHAIEQAGYTVHHEISRMVTQRAQEQGIDQLFLEDPMAFSNELLQGRIEQFESASSGINFYDRGIPDVPAYHKFTGDPIPDSYQDASEKYQYDAVFYLPPWKEIYQSDNERYESYDQAVTIGSILAHYYQDLNYEIVEVPKASVEERLEFILKHVSID